MSKTVKKICPVTGSDEITIEFPDPNELVITQRKRPNGKYRRVLKPRKEVKNALVPIISCPNMEVPLSADIPQALMDSLMDEGKVWCKKIRKVCPTEEISDKMGISL